MSGIERLLEDLCLPHFAERLGDRFLVRINPGTVELVLIEANALPSRVPHASREPFSIVFRGPATPRLSQRIYAFEHEVMGPLEIFIVPIAPDVHGPRYEAIFN